MKRLHLHISVKDLDQSIGFYSMMFGAEPTILKPDYAKWQLNEPAVNFAISIGVGKPGLNHLGIQVDSNDELDEIYDRIDAENVKTMSQENANCCYANSNKHWTLDPSGIPWESFYTMGEVQKFGDDTLSKPENGGCCVTPFKSMCCG